MTEIKHEWRELAASPVTSSPVTPALSAQYYALMGRMDHLEVALKAHENMLADHGAINQHFQLGLEGAVAHSHPDVDKKIADVHETMTAVLKKSLTDQRCTQQTAHDNLKVAFGELATRLEAHKKDHGALAHDVADHGGEINLLHKYIDTLSEDLAKAETKLDTLPAPLTTTNTTVVQKVRNWPAYIALLVSLASTALHFVHLK